LVDQCARSSISCINADAAIQQVLVLHVDRLSLVRASRLPADVDGPSAGTPPTGGTGPLAAAAQQPGSNLMQVEPVAQSDDTWVTVFGFSPDDLALVLQVSHCKSSSTSAGT
jgi:hypothetical protein